MKNKEKVYFINGLLILSNKQRNMIVKHLEDEQLKVILEIIFNVLRGVCKVTSTEKQTMEPFIKILRSLISSDVAVRRRKQLLMKIREILPLFLKAYIRYSKTN